MHRWQIQGRSGFGVQGAIQRGIACGQLRQQVGADGQQVAARQRGDLPNIAKTRAHHLGGNAVAFVVVVNGRHGLHAGVVGQGVVGLHPRCTCRLFVPVVNTSHKGRDELHLGVAAGHRLAKREQQSQVAANAFALQLGGGLYAFPRRSNFDEHAFARYAFGLVQSHDALGAGHGGRGVKAQASIDFGGHAPRDGGQNFLAKAHQQAVNLQVHRLCAVRGHGGFEQGQVFGLLHRLQDERRIGGGVLGLKLGELLEVASVSHDGSELFEGVELVHGLIIQPVKKTTKTAMG